MSKKKAYFDAVQQFDRQVEKLTLEALKQKDIQFAREHQNDPRESFVTYLRQCARELNHSPNMNEVIGGKYIAYRFDGWTNAILAAGLPRPKPDPDLKKRKIFREEFRKQTKILKQENTAKRITREKSLCANAEASREEKEKRFLRDMQWGESHKNDTDENLLAYLRICAERLGHSPYTREVIGGSFITQRFGSWAVALQEAGLPMAQGMKPPTTEQMVRYKTIKKKKCNF